MRVLLISHVLDDADGGASRIYHFLDRGLRDRGHQVTLLHLDDVRRPRGRVGLVAERVALPHLVSLAGAAALTVSARARAMPDVVMSSSGSTYPLFRRLRQLPRPRRPFLVNHIHGLAVADHVANVSENVWGHRGTSLAYRAVTGPFAVRWDAKGIAAADVSVVQNLRDLGEVTDAHRLADVRHVPPAVHPELLAASSAIRTPPVRDPVKILWFASWESRKGAHYVPGAFRLLRAERPDATLTVGGTGLDGNAVRESFDSRDRAAVTVLGRISRDEHASLMRQCSIFLFPSLSEGFGLALPEAMAFGMAAVTTSTGFGADFVTDGVTGRVVAPYSAHIGRALIELAADEGRRTSMAAAGRDLARTFTVDRMVDGYEAVFESGPTRP